MAFLPAANLSTSFEQYPGRWVKFFVQSSTTPLSMSIDSTGDTLLSRAEISAGGSVDIGFLKTAGGSIFIPYLNQSYDAFIFATSQEADVGDTSSAIQIADNVNLSLFGTDTTLLQQTDSIGTESNAGISSGHQIETNFYNSSNKVDSGGVFFFTGTTTVGKAGNVPDADGFFYDADGKQFQIALNPFMNVLKFGAVAGGIADDTAAIVAAIAAGAKHIWYPEGTYLNTNFFKDQDTLHVGDNAFWKVGSVTIPIPNAANETTGSSDVYVNQSTGSDTANNGMSASTAFKTPQYAIDQLPAMVREIID